MRPMRYSAELRGVPVVLPAIFGRVSWFGGPEEKALDVTEDETDWLERYRILDLDPRQYYLAMRWDIEQPAFDGMSISDRKRWWAQQRIRLWNLDFSKAVVVQAGADWGPAYQTRRTMDASPAALDALGIMTDAYAFAEFVEPDHPLGPVQLTRCLKSGVFTDAVRLTHNSKGDSVT